MIGALGAFGDPAQCDLLSALQLAQMMSRKAHRLCARESGVVTATKELCYFALQLKQQRTVCFRAQLV